MCKKYKFGSAYSSLAVSLLTLCLTSVAGIACAQTVQTDAVLQLIDQTDVPARTLGVLSKVMVAEGTVVQEGQLLGEIDDTEAHLERQKAEFELEIAEHEASDDVAIRSAMKAWGYAQAHYDRLLRAQEAQPRSVSKSELEKARLEAEQAEFDMEKGKSELQKAKIRKKLAANQFALAERNVAVRKIFAPQTGVIVELLRTQGEWVKPGEKIVRVVSTKRLRAEGFVKASDAIKNLKGQTVTVRPVGDGLVGEVFKGRIVFVSPEIDPVNDQVRISAEISNPKEVLRPGLRVRMSIQKD